MNVISRSFSCGLLLALVAGCTAHIGSPEDDAEPGSNSGGTSSTSGNTGSGASGTGSGSRTGSGSATGTAGGGSLPPPTDETCKTATTADPGPAISRRLTRGEYDNTVFDLLNDPSKPATTGGAFPAEELTNGFDNAPAALTVSPVLAQAYFDTADALATTAVKNVAALLPCQASAGKGCAEQFLGTFGAKAFRRPLEAAETSRYLKVFDKGAETDFATGIRLMVSALLQSAPFLYRLEFGDGQAGSTPFLKLGSYEMATRLSYAFWRSMPDSELTRAAADNKLTTAAEVEAQARRLVSSTRVRSTVVDFNGQWLGLRRLATLEKDKAIFPKFNGDVASDMRQEVERFVEDVLFGQNPDASQLFTAGYTFVNSNLATYYGLPAPSGSGFQKATVDTTRNSGLLTLGGLLAEHAKSNQTSPVLRGKFVRTQVLCEPISPPPPGVDTTVPDISATASTRERFEQHKTDPSCAACHRSMDPIGLSFENFDAAGKWRDTDAGKPVDASGEIFGSDVAGKFIGAVELGKKLAQSEQVKACIVKNWFRYANARTETANDACALSSLTERFRQKDYDVKELLVALTQTDAFLYRRPNTEGAAP